MLTNVTAPVTIKNMGSDFDKLYEKCKKVMDELLKAAGEDEEKNKKAIAQKIKSYRIGKKLTQDKLAEKLGVTKMEIIRWENARNMPSPLALERLKSLGII